ncbi:mitochondrial carrier domain-containing protein [Daldinia caldariorum]|uniref:mitochondrial carrier domain-containing protein n=1 Tax=Daldinia caldariorum TaxID=326644 RepID=UPI0020076C69|nr:mitochondrial carrier domain-containing protein [Daldinia caldariorum]KAI1469547.1 mitochondrial carrier domain-containing protein [Daldinia caldariorum]
MTSSRYANYYTNIPQPPEEDRLLSALHHAVSGSAGTLISTCTLYPLSLAITRLQARRPVRREARLDSTGSTSSNAGDTTTTPTDPTGPEAVAAAAAAAPGPGVAEAFSRIWRSGGAPRAPWTGLARDTARSALDSFLFFLFYDWFRSLGLGLGTGAHGHGHGRGRRGRADMSVPGLSVLEELAIGVAASACSKLFATPIANVLARKQTAPLPNDGDASIRDAVDAVRKEQGLAGFWSGYPATLVLTLNPSITFCLQELLKRKTVPADRWDNPGAGATFLLAAVSKAVATAITYPLETAAASIRLQTDDGPTAPPNNPRSGSAQPRTDEAAAVEELPKLDTQVQTQTHGRAPFNDEPISPKTEAPPSPSPPAPPLRKVSFTENLAPPERFPGRESSGGYKSDLTRTLASLGSSSSSSVFGAAVRIARAEGVGALYKGILGELARGILGHGTAMLAKDLVHRALFRLYFAVAGAAAEMRARGDRMGGGAGGVEATGVRNRSGSMSGARVEGPLEEMEGMVGAPPVQGRAGTPPLSVRTASPPPPEPQHQLHSLRHRHDNNYDRYRYERLPSPPPPPRPSPSPSPSTSTSYPAAGYGRRPFPANGRDADDDEGGSVVANMIDNSQRGVKPY